MPSAPSSSRRRLVLAAAALLAGLAVVTFVSTGNLVHYLGVALITGALPGVLDPFRRRVS